MAKTQDNLTLQLSTPLGKDVLLLDSLRGTEGVSRLFHFDLELHSEDRAIAFDKIVGQRVTVTLEVGGGEKKRHIDGFVSRFCQLRRDARFTYYRAEVVPWLWFLTRSADCRIFQEMKAPEIIKKVFSDRGMQDVRDALQGDFPKLDYCVQYRERDVDFVTRLMEEHGISYFFEHQQGKHVLVLANSPGAHKACPGQQKVRYKEDERVIQPDKDPGVVLDLQVQQELHPGKHTVTDYNFESPGQDLLGAADTKVKVGGNGKLEVYDYPGLHGDVGGGEAVAKLRMEEDEARHLMVTGRSTCRGFLPGYRFSLEGHYRSDVNQAYVLLEVWHQILAGEQAQGTGRRYENEFTCVPARTPLRPGRSRRKPTVEGPQTAVVVGKGGEEIYTDKHGRVKVQFHWDRKGKWNEKSSCWVRVSQAWAGKGYGAMFLPRVGQEVIVDFLEGDPDRPIITGRVYNAEEAPPYALPDERTKSCIRTGSSKGGGGCNELRFEDKKGKEQIFLHGEQDLDLRVKKDCREWVGKDRHLIVKEVRNEDVGKEFYLKVGKKAVIDVGEELTLRVGGNFIKFEKGGIHIKGKKIYLNTDGPEPGDIPDKPKEADKGPGPGKVDEVPRK